MATASPAVRRAAFLVLGVIALVAVLARSRADETGPPVAVPSPREAPSAERPPPLGTREAPIPGGGLAAHEGIGGSHTIARHVGRSPAELRARAEREGKREVSTFPDLATADRAVGAVLRRRRDEIGRWLASRPSGSEDFEARLDFDAGTVWRAGSARVVPGRTVRVVLAPSDAFDAGYRIVTAYVSLP